MVTLWFITHPILRNYSTNFGMSNCNPISIPNDRPTAHESGKVPEFDNWSAVAALLHLAHRIQLIYPVPSVFYKKIWKKLTKTMLCKNGSGCDIWLETDILS